MFFFLDPNVESIQPFHSRLKSSNAEIVRRGNRACIQMETVVVRNKNETPP
jgi:hypothetical protein